MSLPPKGFTKGELRLMTLLNKHRIFPIYNTPLKFHVVEDDGVKERYVRPDFVVMERIAIEVDGGVHEKAKQRQKDAENTELLKDNGFTVLRFSNTEVLNEEDNVIAAIQEAMRNLH